MIHRNGLILVWVWGLFLLGPSGWCQQDGIELSKDQERRFGHYVDYEITTMFPVLEEPNLGRKIAGIGQSVARAGDRSGEEFTFRVLNTPQVNAFAGPGNYIYVTVGILDLMSSRDELATLIGHEMGHVCERHALHSFYNSQRAINVINILNVLATAGQLSGYTELDLAASVGMIATVIVYQGFSREQESDADRKGIEYAFKAGYNPEAMASLFEKMLKKQKEDKRKGTPVIFSSHPGLKTRISKVKKLAKEIKQSDQK